MNSPRETRAAFAAIVAAGIPATLVPSPDFETDDSIAVGPDHEKGLDAPAQVQVATVGGVAFIPSMQAGEADEWYLRSGTATFDPVEAARAALALLELDRAEAAQGG